MTKPLTYLSTFTGVGGMDMGFDAVGMQCLGMVEIDKHARSILNHHWPEVPKHDDITTAISSGWAAQFVGRTDVLIGGAPCQDLSAAGKRAGFAGERSGLFFDQLRLADHVGARWLVYENVPGLLTSNNGWDFREALHQMAESGFVHAEWRELDSQRFGVPQRRKRIFVVAYRDTGDLGGREVLTQPEGMRWNPAPFIPPRAEAPRGVEGGVGEGRGGVLADSGVVQALTQGLGSGGPDAQHAQAGWLIPQVDGVPVLAREKPITFAWQNGGGYKNSNDGLAITEDAASPMTKSQVQAVADGYTVRRLTPRECERLQAWPDDHTRWGVTDDGKEYQLVDTQRYRQIGNGVTSTVAAYVGSLINAAEQEMCHA